jgi:hypothetical protein
LQHSNGSNVKKTARYGGLWAQVPPAVAEAAHYATMEDPAAKAA